MDDVEFEARKLLLGLPSDIDEAIAVLLRATEIMEECMIGPEHSRSMH